MKNKKYRAIDDWQYEELPVSKEELEEARKKATALIIESPNHIMWRSCWICNHAHVHFLKGKWGNWVLNCFECGRFFYDKIDITDYKEKSKK